MARIPPQGLFLWICFCGKIPPFFCRWNILWWGFLHHNHDFYNQESDVSTFMKCIWHISSWWFQPTPLKNDGVSNSWDDDMTPIWWENHNPFMFQSPPIRYPLPLCLALRRSKQLHRSPRYAANMEFVLEGAPRILESHRFHGEFTGFMVNNNVVLTGKFSILIYIIYLVGGWPTPRK